MRMRDVLLNDNTNDVVRVCRGYRFSVKYLRTRYAAETKLTTYADVSFAIRRFQDFATHSDRTGDSYENALRRVNHATR